MIRDVKDYPKQGILFKDITPVLKDSAAFSSVIEELARRLSGTDFDYVIGIEARGFIIGSALAYRLGKGFIPIRKKGKLPYKTIGIEYALEYGSAAIEMHSDAIAKGSTVVIVDDLLATGGTASAAAELVRRSGGIVKVIAFLIELEFLNGRDKIKDTEILSLIKY